jgi:hypothetical protein
MVTRTAAKRENEAGAGHAVDAPSCRHHWILEAPEARTSHGECLLCKARREFPNYLSDCLIDSDEEHFEAWLARQGRTKPKKGGERGLPFQT